jgi:hypothetical protein
MKQDVPGSLGTSITEAGLRFRHHGRRIGHLILIDETKGIVAVMKGPEALHDDALGRTWWESRSLAIRIASHVPAHDRVRTRGREKNA